MDKTDYRILRILKENGRETASNIGKEIHLSVSAVLDRIKKLEDSGVIKSYTILVDSSKLGNDVIALMEVSLEHPHFYDEFTEAVREIDAVVDCYYLTGDFDFNLKVVCASSDELEQIHRRIKSIPGVSATRTHFALKEVKNVYASIPGE